MSAPTWLRPGGRWRNWARSESAWSAYAARPADVAEVQSVVRFAAESGLAVKTVGAGHSFTAIAATTGIRLDVSAIGGVLDADPATGRVRLGAGTGLHRLPALLGPLGLALSNMGDIDRQTLAGATSTGTHGTGVRFGGLATQVVAVTLVTATGELLHVSETEHAELLPAVRLGLGALGVLVDLTIQCVPAFLLSAVEEPLGFDEVLDGLDERIAAADHFEFYWFPHSDRVAAKANTRLPAGAERHPLNPVREWLDDVVIGNWALAAACAAGRLVPAATPPLNRFAAGVLGNRGFTDDSQSVFTSPRTTRFREMEYAIPIESIGEALREVRGLIERSGWRISFPVEVRMGAADDDWLSTAQGRASGYIAVHRHFREDPEEYFRGVETVLRRYGGRPHWAKMHYQDAAALAAVYPYHADFVAVRDRLDPERRFGNPYLERVLGP